MSDPLAAVALTVTTSASAEIFLIDSRLELIARDIGRLETRQPAGVYKLKIRQGRALKEQVVLLEQDMILDVEAPEFSTAVPLLGTRRSHEYHFDVAQQNSQHVDTMLGRGSPDTSIFVLARYWTGAYTGVESRRTFGAPAHGLSLRRYDDKDSVELAGNCRPGSGPNWDPSAACTVSVEPGPYVLRSQLSTGAVIEQIVHAVAGWQTQVFVLRQPDAESRAGLPATGNTDDVSGEELFSLSIMMGRGAFRDDGQLRLTELARIALADERPLLSDELTTILRGKHENPILGILGAHLLLLCKSEAERQTVQRLRNSARVMAQTPASTSVFDQGFYNEVIDNLRRMLGTAHPDVEALSLRSTTIGASTQMIFDAPPMLRQSWSLLVEASAEQPELVPLQTWKRLAQLTATRPYLSWLRPKSDRAVDAQLTKVLRERVNASRRPRGLERPGGGSQRVTTSSIGDVTVGSSADLSTDRRKQLSLELELPRSAVDWLIQPQVPRKPRVKKSVPQPREQEG